MAGSTSYLGLILPADTEPYDVNKVNDNNVKIDTELKNRNDLKGIIFGHAGKTDGTQLIGTVDGAVTLNAAQDLRGGMTFDAASGGRLVIPKAGLYLVTVRLYGTGGTGYNVGGGAYYNGTPIAALRTKFWKAGTEDVYNTISAHVECVVGDKLGIGMISTAGGAWGTTGYDGTWLEARYVGKA